MNKEQLIEKFKNNPKSMNAGAGKLARRYNLTREEVISAKKIATLNHFVQNGEFFLQSHSIAIPKPLSYTISTSYDVNDGKLQSERECDFEPKTVDELAELHKIDLDKYKITNYWSKLKSNGKFTSSTEI